MNKNTCGRLNCTEKKAGRLRVVLWYIHLWRYCWRTFKALKLPWEKGDYYRTDTEYPAALGNIQAELPRIYSQKAVLLKGVDSSSAFWTYEPAEGAMTQSHVFPATRVSTTECATVCYSRGFGFVSYLGYVNNEEESTAVVIRMCQL